MRWLLILVVLASALWSGWWFAGSAGVRKGTDEAINMARSQGWQIAYSDLSVSGFPNRFDTRIESLDVLAPDRVWGLSAPFLHVFALSYRPNHIIAVPASQLDLSTPVGPVAVTSADLRASAVLSLAVPPDLRRATLVFDGLSAMTTGGRVDAQSGQLAMRQADDAPEVYDAAVTLRTLQSDLLDDVLPPGLLPETLDALDLDASLTFDRPFQDADREPRLAALALRNASLAFDTVDVALSGDVTIGPDGAPEGTLLLTANNWRALLDRLMVAGLIPENRAPLVTAALTGMSDGDQLRVPIGLRNGVITAAGFPVGRLPRLPAPQSP